MAIAANDFLHYYPRIPRIPLDYWAGSLLRLLQSLLRTQSAEYVTLIPAINRAALIFTYLGERSTAKQICAAELSLIAERSSKLSPSDSAPLFRLAIDPWVNYGRLLSTQGAAEEAREHFAIAYSLNSGVEVSLGPCCITPEIWMKIKEIDSNMKNMTQAVYVIDSLKAYFLSVDFLGALQFIRDLQWIELPDLWRVVDEGDLIAASRLGLHNRVLATTEKPLYETDLYYQAILTLYSIDSHLAIGAQNVPRSAEGLAVLVAQGVFDLVPPTSMLRFIEKLGDLLERLGEQMLALSVYIKGLELARQTNDQPSEWFFLKCLLRLGDPLRKQHAEWKDAYHQIIAACDYVSVRRAEGLTPAKVQSSNVYERLLEVIRDITRYEFASL